VRSQPGLLGKAEFTKLHELQIAGHPGPDPLKERGARDGGGAPLDRDFAVRGQDRRAVHLHFVAGVHDRSVVKTDVGVQRFE
jgi:hypothetical protein